MNSKVTFLTMVRIILYTFLIIVIIPNSLFAQGNEEWLILDERLEKVMNECADKIDGDPLYSADAYRYLGMDNLDRVLAWAFDWHYFTYDNINDDSWINAGVFDSEASAIEWWGEQNLDDSFGDANGVDGRYSYQLTDFPFNEYTATVNAFGVDATEEVSDAYVEGKLSWRVGRFIFQVGIIQRITHALLIEDLKRDAQIIYQKCKDLYLFDAIVNIDDIIIHFFHPPFYAGSHSEFMLIALDESGNTALNFNAIINLKAFDYHNNQLMIEPTYSVIKEGIGQTAIFFFESALEVRLHAYYKDIESISAPFKVRQDIEGDLTFEGELSYSKCVELTITYSELNPLTGNRDLYQGDGMVEFNEENGLGTFIETSDNIHDGRVIVSYLTPSATEVGEIYYLEFVATLVIPNGEEYLDSYVFGFPGGKGGSSELPDVLTFGGPGSDNLNGIGFDKDPDKHGGYLFFEFEEEVELIDQILYSEGEGDLGIVRIDDSDDAKWIATCGGEGDERPNNMVVSSYGTTTLSFDYENSTIVDKEFLDYGNGKKVLIGTWDSNGNLVYAISSESATKSTSVHYGDRVRIDHNGNALLIGAFEGDIQFNSYNGTNSWTGISNGRREWFVVKFDPTGNVLWGLTPFSHTDNSFNTVEGLDVDDGGNVFIGGEIDDSCNIGSLIVADDCLFILKLDPYGDALWVKEIYGIGSIWDLIIDSDNCVWITGTFRWDMNFSGIEIDVPDSERGMFLAKYSSDGQPLFVKSYLFDRDAGNEFFPRKLAADSKGNIAVTGRFDGTLQMDNQLLSAPDEEFHVFVGLFNSVGNLVWLEQSDGEGSASAYSIQFDNNDQCYVGGRFYRTVSFASHTLTSNGMGDAFLVKVPATASSTEDNKFINQYQSDIDLSQNYPNPFSDKTTINYSLNQSGLVSLKVYSIFGTEVLFEETEHQVIGEQLKQIDLRKLKPGIYFYQLRLDGGVPMVGKMIKVN